MDQHIPLIGAEARAATATGTVDAPRSGSKRTIPRGKPCENRACARIFGEKNMVRILPTREQLTSVSGPGIAVERLPCYVDQRKVDGLANQG